MVLKTIITGTIMSTREKFLFILKFYISLNLCYRILSSFIRKDSSNEFKVLLVNFYCTECKVELQYRPCAKWMSFQLPQSLSNSSYERPYIKHGLRKTKPEKDESKSVFRKCLSTKNVYFYNVI